MRVIAGSAGGIPLVAPKKGVRPTMDRVKEAIFSSLGDAVIGATVLDLFAGTGSLGIEAASRGAAAVVWVESDATALSFLEKNLIKCKLRTSGDLALRMQRADAIGFVEKTAPESYDIIFADPPYGSSAGERDFAKELLQNKNLPRILKLGGLFILEMLARDPIPQGAQWTITREKRYGSTKLLFLEPAAPVV